MSDTTVTATAASVTKKAIDIDYRKTIPILSGLTVLAGLFVIGNPPMMTFDHLMPNSWIPTALQISRLIAFAAPALAGTHSVAATYSPRTNA